MHAGRFNNLGSRNRKFLDLTSSKTSMGNIEDPVSKQKKNHKSQKRTSKTCVDEDISIKRGIPVVRVSSVTSVPLDNSVAGPGVPLHPPSICILNTIVPPNFWNQYPGVTWKLLFIYYEIFKYYFYILRLINSNQIIVFIYLPCLSVSQASLCKRCLKTLSTY